MEQFVAVGKRKRAVARIYLRPGKGKFEINNQTPEEYFGVRNDFDDIIRQPLKETSSVTKFDVKINVVGGGVRGQVEAIRHGISRALEKANPDFRPPLKKKGFLTRDAREVERKKPGQPKARKRYQFYQENGYKIYHYRLDN